MKFVRLAAGRPVAGKTLVGECVDDDEWKAANRIVADDPIWRESDFAPFILAVKDHVGLRKKIRFYLTEQYKQIYEH